ncbi:hypothetical protein AB0F91_39940 [Amycolatopsis sp. NPDC023774]|uniref:hypothetical protein n=1 Tax=Amycolatopsis sp. NPDC023774 TaxID=3155015 RepID=UPI00340B701A
MFDETFRDPVWADATFDLTSWDDPATPAPDTAGFIASLGIEPGLLTGTEHPFDTVTDPELLEALVAEAELELDELDVTAAPDAGAEVITANFGQAPAVTSWAA